MIEKIDDRRINELTEAIVLEYLKRAKQNPKKMIWLTLTVLQRIISALIFDMKP